MSFLLDTNVVSEPLRPQPEERVIRWLAAADESRVYVSVGTLAEIRRGIERMPRGNRRDRYDGWLLYELAPRFHGRVLSVDSIVADAWGRITAQRQTSGRPIEAVDAMIAATAEVHNLTLVTRNVSDFQGTVKSLLNPWSR